MSPELLIEMNDLLKQHPGTATARTAEPETTGWNKIGYARAYLRFGDVDKARDRLLDVVFHHRGTTAAAEAQRLLDAI